MPQCTACHRSGTVQDHTHSYHGHAVQMGQEVAAQAGSHAPAGKLQAQLLAAAVHCRAELAAYMKAAVRSFWQPPEVKPDASQVCMHGMHLLPAAGCIMQIVGVP